MTGETFVITQPEVFTLATMKLSGKVMKSKTLALSVLMIASALLTASAAVHRTAALDNGGGGGGLTQTPATFSNYEVAGNPFTTNTNPAFSVGVTCPNSSRTCQNTEGEPAIRADKSGNFYGSSEDVFCVIGGQCGGTFAYRSTDGGSHFTTLPLPNSFSTGKLPPTCNPPACTSAGLSPAGGDTDLAVAPVKNAKGFYNLYVASLATTPPLANIFVSTSQDGGDSWVVPIKPAASIPVDDREWAAADGASKVCISYHSTVTTNDIVVNCSYDAGTTFPQTASAFDAEHFLVFAGFNNVIGNLAIDPHNHLIYQVFSSVKDAIELANCTIFCHVHTVWIGVSINGGLTFTNYMIYNNPNTNVDYGHQFINISVDKAGNLYAVYDDNHNMFYSFSTNFGQTWTGPFQVNKPDSNTAIFPWSSAGSAGQLDIVWYGTSFFDPTLVPDTYPSTAAWKVYFAQNLNALTPGSSFTQVNATNVIHYGAVCESGVTCTGNRDLLDDFGVATSPTTGKAVIIYTNDQFLNSAAEPATRRTSGSYVCNPSVTNTVDCSHTDIAVQTGGSTVNQKPHHFEVDDEDFEELDVSNDGGHLPHNEIDITNTGNIAINQFHVEIGGLPWTLAWSSNSPIQPGQSIQSISTTVPLGLPLTVGNVYQVTLTATLADGTTETQTINAIYSLGAGLGL